MYKILYILLCSVFLYSSSFKLYKMHTQKNPQTTILIIGGIHGNEPGSYFAPALFAEYYTITQGAVWIIPALNKPSIQINARGRYGDMNRKFKYISKDDKDYNKVKEIKKLILNKKVDMILNLHDGHGFFREKWENNVKNPYAWGQSSVIDQHKINSDVKFANLYKVAKNAIKNANMAQGHKNYKIRVKNTNTKTQNLEQQNSLTYFAVQNNKPAFAIETSKSIKDLSLKVLYQLRTIEGYLKVAKIKYKRQFELTQENIQEFLDKYGNMTINKNISFNISNIRPYITFVPLLKKHNDFVFSHPLASVSYSRGLYHIHIGNKHIASLKPQYFRIEKDIAKIDIKIDDEIKKVKIGSSVKVANSFEVKASKEIRVNVIGYGKRNDNYKKIYKKDLQKRYSLNLNHTLYRIEFYKSKTFLGMIVVHFSEK